MSSFQYVVYIPDGIMDFSCTVEIPEDAKVVDLWNAARKTFPMLSQCRIIIFKVTFAFLPHFWTSAYTVLCSATTYL